ncbi:uncharacterized protein [Typha angustifolia]|uniref:uncharacterized protein isoform X1 n=1 Tax=Typha angustifolia TaxID=59011 RepID=UPI003C2AE752
MPPSPVLRRSPGRDHRMVNNHKRGRSIESRSPFQATDDDLVLFTDMQNRERDNFLLHTSDDFEDSITKLRCYPDFKLGGNIKPQGEGGDLLGADADKNDYDWLLTPPDTPLFRTLDDDEPQSVELPSRGRLRSQPIPIIRASMTETMRRSSRSSASPHRLSPSPRSSCSASQGRGRPSSSSPSPIIRPTTPSQRSSTPNRPISPTPRSSTPVLRRTSSGSSGQISSSGRKGVSPANSKTTRGNSASPKLQAWQANLPGFLSDAPPNLRTSLSDRPTTHVRGFSPASRNGRDISSSKTGRQSISPNPCRSRTLTHSNEQERFSSCSKGSLVSSGDDDVDSIHSTARISVSPGGRNYKVTGKSRDMSCSKRPSRTLSASSAPKRSFDSGLRTTDYGKTPQNMFRPLLSSVPATTFSTAKASYMRRPIFSRNSSLTTSSNASSEHGTTVAPDFNDNDHDQNDLMTGLRNMEDPGNQDEVFLFDKVDEKDEVSGTSPGKLEYNYSLSDGVVSTKNDTDPMTVVAPESSHLLVGDDSEDYNCRTEVTCLKCGKVFRTIEAGQNTDICKECAKEHYIASEASVTDPPMTLKETTHSELPSAAYQHSELQLETHVGELSEKNEMTNQIIRNLEEGSYCSSEYQSLVNSEQGPYCSSECHPLQGVMDELKRRLSSQKLDGKQEVDALQSDSDNKQEEQSSHQSLRIDSPEGTGISVVLLQRSSSSKWPVVQGRALSAASILCSDPSYVRDKTSSLRCSIGKDSASTSSIDLGPYRRIESHHQRQQSIDKGEMDSLISNYGVKVEDTALSVSCILVKPTEDLSHIKIESEGSFDSSQNLDYEASRETILVNEDNNKAMESTGNIAGLSSSSGQVFPDRDASLHADVCRELDAETPQANCSFDNPLADCSNEADHSSCLSPETFQDKDCNIADSNIPDFSLIQEDYLSTCGVCEMENSDVSTDSSSDIIMDLQNDCDSLQCSQTESAASQNVSYLGASNENSISIESTKDGLACVIESIIMDHACSSYEESTSLKVDEQRGHTEDSTVVTIQNSRSNMSRSLTLEEATDTILFCSSIVHDLVFKAATIGMQKELMLTDVPLPVVTVAGASVSAAKGSQMLHIKRTPKSMKAKWKRSEDNVVVSSMGLENNIKPQEATQLDSEIPNKVDTPKPPKLESKCNCTIM